jgi:hypothetical protein
MAAMKVTASAAMRARDVSRPHAEHLAHAEAAEAVEAKAVGSRPADAHLVDTGGSDEGCLDAGSYPANGPDAARPDVAGSDATGSQQGPTGRVRRQRRGRWSAPSGSSGRGGSSE